MLKFLVIIGLLLLANNSADAQSQPALCSDSFNMAFNATQLSGVWWEVARNPALAGLACVKVNFTEIQPENVLEIAITYAVSNTYLWSNRTMYANVSLANSNVYNMNGYNISYNDGTYTTKYAVYKLLNTDYENYALICGYTNVTNTATSFGIYLTRERNPNMTQLIELEDAASTLYSDFSFGNMPLVNQSSSCYTSDAATPYSIKIATLFAFLCISVIFAI
ncbi:uncharacterized protein LOC135948962 [Calliphora vicina]|uniref:uncharacterized protein LOC135948962 n=1 Tax=Calliphora vicina TaxID=7373 RepID=UPI00325ACA4C